MSSSDSVRQRKSYLQGVLASRMLIEGVHKLIAQHLLVKHPSKHHLLPSLSRLLLLIPSKTTNTPPLPHLNVSTTTKMKTSITLRKPCP